MTDSIAVFVDGVPANKCAVLLETARLEKRIAADRAAYDALRAGLELIKKAGAK